MLTDILGLCKEKQITLTRLSDLTGVSKGYLSLINQGKRKNVSYPILERIAKVLGVSATDLLNDIPYLPSSSIDIQSISAVLALWDVPPEQRDEFNHHLDKMTQHILSSTSKIFSTYEHLLVSKILCKSFNWEQIKLMVVSAMQEGSIALDLAEKIIGDERIPKEAFVVNTASSLVVLKLRPKHVITRYWRYIPEVTDQLFSTLKETGMEQPEAYFYIAGLCKTINLDDLALRYYGNAALSAWGEENRTLLEKSMKIIRSFPLTSLREMIVGWYDSTIYSSQGLYEKALTVLQSSLDLPALGTTEQRFKSRIYSTSGVVYMAQGNYKLSLNNFRESIRLEAQGPLSALTYINIGTLMHRVGRLEQAKNYFNYAINTGESFALASALSSLAQIALDQKEYTMAHQLIIKGYRATKLSKKQMGKSELCISLGVYYKETGNYTRALYWFRLASRRTARRKETKMTCYICLEIADVYIRTNRLEEAQILITELHDLMVGQGDILMLGFWLNNKAKVYLAKQNASIALTFLKEAYTALGYGAYTSLEYDKCLKLLEQAYTVLHEPYQAQFFRDESIRQRRKVRSIQ